MRKSILSLSLLSICAVSQAQVSPLNNHQSTEITQSEAKAVWNDMNTSFESGSECFNRAMSWTYDTHKKYGFEAKKILIHYSLKYNQELSPKFGTRWGFHIAPMYNVEGKETVLDKGFQPSLHAPVSAQMWEEYFLSAGTSKLVEKRIKLKNKIRKTQEAIYDLDKSSEMYYESLKSKKEKLAEYKADLVKFKITDEDLKKQKPKKLEQTKRWVNYLTEELTNARSIKTKNSLKNQLRFYTDLLKKVKTDINYAAHIQCKKITNIEELDYNLMGEWCFIQEVNQYYWGVPQLRLLNYGKAQRSEIPNKSQLPQARRDGAQYEQTQFDMRYVWAARKQAFGSTEHKEIWSSEYERKELSGEAVKDIDNIVDDIEDELSDAKKDVKKLIKVVKKEKAVMPYLQQAQEVLAQMQQQYSQSKELMKSIYSMATSVQLDDVESKISNFTKAKRIKKDSELKAAKIESKYVAAKNKAAQLKKQRRDQERQQRDRVRSNRRRR